jgi:hypothetical protein
MNVGSGSTVNTFSNFFQVASGPNGTGLVNDLTSSTMGALDTGAYDIARYGSYTFPSPGTYSVRVCADKTNRNSLGVITEVDENNNCADWSNVTINIPPPAAPTGVSASATSCAVVDVSWNASAGATSYNIYRSTTSGSGYWPVRYGVNSPYGDNTGIVPNTTYYYVIKAVGPGGASPDSTQASATSVGPCLPDVIAAAPSPSTATAFTPVDFTSVITNIGDSDTNTNFPYFFQLADGPNGTGLVNDLTPPHMTMSLPPSASGTGFSPFHTFQSPGTYSIRACGDKTDRNGGGMVLESNENNNCGSWTDVIVN